jgi:putative glycosyltransferase
MKLSVVTMMYHSLPYISEFYDRITAAVNSITSDYELIFVNDGSPDSSLDAVLNLQMKDQKIKIVDLSRNFGHHKAAVAGLAEASGEKIFLIDCDLEEQPEWLPEFYRDMTTHNVDVVFGIQRERKGGFLKKYSGGLFYKIFNALSEINIPENLCTVRLMTYEYVKSLLSLKDKNLFLAGNCSWVGYRQRPMVVDKTSKRQSRYTLMRMTKLFIEAVSSFSGYPLQIIFVAGFIISLIAGLIGIEMIVGKLLNPTSVLLGYASLMVSIWFLGGLIVLFVGVIGIYLSKMFNEIKDRPQYIVRNIYDGKRKDG